MKQFDKNVSLKLTDIPRYAVMAPALLTFGMSVLASVLVATKAGSVGYDPLGSAGLVAGMVGMTAASATVFMGAHHISVQSVKNGGAMLADFGRSIIDGTKSIFMDVQANKEKLPPEPDKSKETNFWLDTAKSALLVMSAPIAVAATMAGAGMLGSLGDQIASGNALTAIPVALATTALAAGAIYSTIKTRHVLGELVAPPVEKQNEYIAQEMKQEKAALPGKKIGSLKERAVNTTPSLG